MDSRTLESIICSRFDLNIGRLDRMLSELIESAASGSLDDPDKQTLKHHAEDMIGAGNKIIKLLHSEVFDDVDELEHFDRLPTDEGDEPIDTTRLDKSRKGTKKKRSVTSGLIDGAFVPVDDDTPTAAELFMDQVGPDITTIRNILTHIMKGIDKLSEN